MKIKYFKDTDTALLEFSDQPVAETRDVGEDFLIDLDADGNIVSMTIEHAKKNTNLPAVTVQELGRGAA